MRYVIAFLFCNLTFLSFSQVVDYFHLLIPIDNVTTSLYRTVNFIDSRKNKLFNGEFIPITEPSEGRIAVRAMKNISETINPGGTRLYNMMIDHTDGSLIQIKEHK